VKKRQGLLEEIIKRVSCLSRSLKGNRGVPFDCHSLSKSQTDILFELFKHPAGVSVKDLAREVGVTSGAVTQLTDGLVAKGLMTRVENADDRRLLLLKLTPEATENFCEFRLQYLDSLDPIFTDMNDTELEDLVTLLRKVKTKETV